MPYTNIMCIYIITILFYFIEYSHYSFVTICYSPCIMYTENLILRYWEISNVTSINSLYNVFGIIPAHLNLHTIRKGRKLLLPRLALIGLVFTIL